MPTVWWIPRRINCALRAHGIPPLKGVLSGSSTFGSLQFVSECTLFRYVDRVNLANARVLNSDVDPQDNIVTSLGLQSGDWQWAISLVYWGIMLMEVPSNYFLKRFGPKIWLARIIITWGTIVACMAGVTNPAGLKAARFFLGVAEAGMLPGVVFYMSFWYKPTERATRVAWYFGGSSIAGGVSGLIAIGAGNLNGKGGLKAWQWLFIIEGVFSVLYGIMAHFVMLDYPETPTTVLTPAERDVAMRRLPRNAPKSTESDFDWVAFWDVMAQPAQWLFLFSYLTLNIGVFGATAFLPSVLQGLGFTGGVSSNLASIGPNFATLVFYVAVSWHSDFTRERMWHYVIPMTISTIGSFFLTGAAYNPPSDTNAYRTITLKGSTEVGMALGWMSAIAFVAALISPFMYPDEAYPEYVAAMLWGTIAYAISAISVLLIPLAIKWQNRRALEYLKSQGLFDDDAKAEADAIGLEYDKTLLEKV
ncbi:MFS general substrate transporter [Gonapodya prolifera JEL478]|uniref:MFS general substrate transporter n=1 Tax=Gonapodya prolifera (strain JEL478) TaxID=1344416 RepID=A0A139AU94_GONPJ|nr:MFS general substrate transporter [Gonapodya prolifera JEL478]|eukprot:KXS20277.1 MFS general substrate transporter [Gonapodya prolifera JEL478]